MRDGVLKKMYKEMSVLEPIHSGVAGVGVSRITQSKMVQWQYIKLPAQGQGGVAEPHIGSGDERQDAMPIPRSGEQGVAKSCSYAGFRCRA